MFRTWFLVDLGVVLCDWMSILGSSMSDNLKFVRFAKASRIVRVIGFIRLFRLGRFWEGFFDRYGSDGLSVVSTLLGTCIVVLWFSHIICCVFYALGATRVQRHGFALDPHDHSPSMTWFTGTMTSAPPTSTWWLCIGPWRRSVWAPSKSLRPTPANGSSASSCCCLGFLSSSVIAATFSSALINWSLSLSEDNKQIRRLRQYFKQMEVEPELAVRLSDEVRRRRCVRQMLSQDDVPALTLLSVPSKSELHFTICAPYLSLHPLFRFWATAYEPTVHDFCDEACSVEFLTAGDNLFRTSEAGESAYVVMIGDMEYSQDPFSSSVLVNSRVGVDEGTWLCEAALWTCWFHVGTAQASGLCQVLVVNAASTLKVIKRGASYVHGHEGHMASCFTNAWYQRPFPHKVTDLFVPGTDFADIVVGMDLRVRVEIGRGSLAHTEFHQHAFAQAPQARFAHWQMRAACGRPGNR